MSSINAEKLKKIQEFIDLTKATLTYDEFLSAFKEVVDYVKKIETELNQKIDSKTQSALNSLEDLQSQHQDAIKEMKSENSSTFSNVKKWALESVGNLYAKSQINDKIKELDTKLEEVNNLPDASSIALEASKLASEGLLPLIPIVEKVEEKLPLLGVPIREGLEALVGDERLDKSAIKGLEEFIRALIPSQKLGGIVPGTRLQNTCSGWVTPTGALDGANKTFTVTGSPLVNTSEVQLNGQGYYDFTVSGSTYTLTDAPVSTDLLKVRHWL